MPDGHVVAMKDAEFQWRAQSDPRLAAYAASRLPAWLWIGRRHADPVGQSGRRPRVRRGERAALSEKTFGPADRHRRQIARLAGRLLAGRRHPAGAAAGLWRGARQACDLRLFAVRFSRWQPRRSDRRRQDRADRAATDADASADDGAQSADRIVSAGRIRANSAAERTRHARHGATGRAATRCPMTSSRHNRAKRPPGLRCSMRLPSLLPRSRQRLRPLRACRLRPHRSRPSKRLPTGQRRLPLRFTWQMDRDGRFTLGTDEFAGLIGPRTDGRVRPAMARDRRDLRPRSHRPDDAGICDRAPPGAASR